MGVPLVVLLQGSKALSKRPTRKVHRDIEAISINITPVMNLFVVLIPFLLMSAVFVQISVIDSVLPKLSTATTIIQKKEKDKLLVSVYIRSDGFSIGKVGGNPRPQFENQWAKGDLGGRIPKTNNKEFNFEALNNQMIKIKNSYPDAESVVIFPDGEIPYEELIKTMDATRETKVQDASGQFVKRYLFPDAVIGHVAEGK